MLGEVRSRELAEQALAGSRAGEMEIVVICADRALTRFANSTIHQNVVESDVELRARAVQGRRVGVASTNELSADGIARVVERALDIAERQREDPEFPGLPGPGPITSMAGHDQLTEDFTPRSRASAVKTICDLAEDAGIVASGALSTSARELAVASSRGVWAFERSTSTHARTVMMGEGEASGYAARTSVRVGDIDAEDLAREAIEKTLRSRSAVDLEPGEYPVVLEDYAVGEALSYLSYMGFGALALQEGHSFLAGRLGQQVMSEPVTIWDDGHDTRGLPASFDFEGVGKQKVNLIERGVARGVVYDSRTAARDGKKSTGHALPAPNTFGPFAWNLCMAPGQANREQMARQVERGIWITRFHYVNVVHPRDAILTGMTRDGTFLIEHGEIGRPVRNLRFTQNMLEALSSVRAVGSQVTAVEGFFGASVVPALLIDRFNFTGSTAAAG